MAIDGCSGCTSGYRRDVDRMWKVVKGGDEDIPREFFSPPSFLFLQKCANSHKSTKISFLRVLSVHDILGRPVNRRFLRSRAHYSDPSRIKINLPLRHPPENKYLSDNLSSKIFRTLDG